VTQDSPDDHSGSFSGNRTEPHRMLTIFTGARALSGYEQRVFLR